MNKVPPSDISEELRGVALYEKTLKTFHEKSRKNSFFIHTIRRSSKKKSKEKSSAHS